MSPGSCQSSGSDKEPESTPQSQAARRGQTQHPVPSELPTLVLALAQGTSLGPCWVLEVPIKSPRICLPREDSPWVIWALVSLLPSLQVLPAQVAVLVLQGLQAEPGTGIQPLCQF